VPEVEDTVCAGRKETGTDDDIRKVRRERTKETLQIVRIIFEVSVLDSDEIARRLFEPGMQCSAFTLIHLVPQDAHLRVPERKFFRKLEGIVHRRVINYENLDSEIGIRDCQDALDAAHKSPLFIVGRDND
jgi:hypothetical protein